MEVWCVFRKLELYYDDNDSILESIRETEQSCEEYIKKNFPYWDRSDFIVEKWNVRK